MSIPFSPPLALKAPTAARPHRFQYDFTSTPVLNSTNVKPEQVSKTVKRSLAYTIPLEYASTNSAPPNKHEKETSFNLNNIHSSSNKCGHILSVTSLATTDCNPNFNLSSDFQNDAEPYNYSQFLYTGGRDGTVKLWSIESNLTESGNSTEPQRVIKNLASSTHHNDWINSIISINGGRTVVSGSSDLSIRAWTPFSEDGGSIETIGSHSDYVKTLTYCQDHNKILSGGLDSTIKIWDANIAGTSTLWLYDMRTNSHTGRLSGHTDFITSVLVSENGEYLLSGSSDATIKLWSLKSKKCILTFSCHDSSVWSLFSNDPTLSTFYSGDKNGNLFKTKHKSQTATDISILIGKEKKSILEILPEHDENHLWTANFGLGFNCWKNITDNHFDKKVEYIQKELFNTNDLSEKPDDLKLGQFIEPVYSEPVMSVLGPAGLKKHIVLQNKRQVLAINTDDEISLWDLISAKCVKIFEKEWGTDLESIAGSLNNPPQNLPSWCSVDTKIGLLTIKMEMSQIWDTEVYADQLDELTNQDRINLLDNGCERINIGLWVIKNLLKNFDILDFLYDNDSLKFANSVNSWVANFPDGGELTLESIIAEYSNKITFDLSRVQIAEPVEKPVELPSAANEKSKSMGLFRSATTGDQDKQNPTYKGIGKLFSWKYKKSKVEKKAFSEIPVSESLRNKLAVEESIIDTLKDEKNNADPTETNSNPKFYSQCSEVQKNLICFLSSKAQSQTITNNKILYYPTVELSSNLKMLIFEEVSNGSVPYCIYSSTIANAKTNHSSFSFRKISGSHKLTLGLCLPSWIPEFFICNKYPISYKPPSHLQFTLRPYSLSLLQLRSLGSEHTNLSAHPMLRAAKLSLYIAEQLNLQLPPELYIKSLVKKIKEIQTMDTTNIKSGSINVETSVTDQLLQSNNNNIAAKKSILELALEDLGEYPAIEERVALRVLCKLPNYQIPELLKPILAMLSERYPLYCQNPIVSSQSKNSELNSQSFYNAESSANKSAKDHHGSELLYEKSQSENHDSSLHDTNENNTTHLMASKPLDSFNCSDAYSNFSASQLDKTKNQNLNNLSFIWIEILCRGKKLDPLTTLGTIRSSIWKSSQEIEITYNWKSFIIDRLGDSMNSS
ncbi:hypothetical protein BB561_002033 [Smittium simulii]|uniref:Uncharacterized protein n=1 Tax=Smittium simulii TaxID=133385 RepID=A0A2T9YS22_9FUNG|nr:hypothetical protein BB561_002033 [Smittium simulii]